MKRLFTSVKEFVREEYKFIIVLVLLYLILQMPVNYYIIMGGGVSDVSSRIDVSDGYQGKGSFNISYVTELKGTVTSYLLSYIVPTWERESVNAYKYTTTESVEDIEFRSELDLKTANGTATYWAYTLANQEVRETASKIYFISISSEYENPFLVGDELLSIDGFHYDTIQEYKDYLQHAGDEVDVVVLRGKKEISLTGKLYEKDGAKILGVVLQMEKEYETDPEVSIHFNRSESGPSGGLITTLEIYNQLTKKDYTKGYKIAGTGTIELDGTIGQIGGVEYKLLGAEDADSDYFLVPSGDNYKDAVAYKKKKNLKIQLIEVKTIEDAIEKLEALE